MGKRRKKLLYKKWSKLPWNKNSQSQAESVEDNSVMIEKLKAMEPEVVEEVLAPEPEIEELFEESVIEPELEEAAPEINLSSLRKRELLDLAKEKGLEDVSWRNTKNEIIAAIQKAD